MLDTDCRKETQDSAGVEEGGFTGRVSGDSQEVPWIEYDIVRGWTVVLRIFKLFTQQCDCTPLISRNDSACSYCVTYHMECGYCNRLQCK